MDKPFNFMAVKKREKEQQKFIFIILLQWIDESL
jgi:hypothetical protein